MEDGKIGDDLSPEDPGHVSEGSYGHSGNKSCPQNCFTNDGELEDSSGDNSDTEASVKRRKRVQRFSDSDSEDENQKTACTIDYETSKDDLKSQANACISATSSDSDTVVSKSQTHKSRIKKISSDSSSDSDNNESDKHSDVPLETSQGSQIKNKKDKLHQKFENLLTSENLEVEDVDSKVEKGEKQNDRNSDVSDNDEANQNQAHNFRIKKVSLDSSSDSDLKKGDTHNSVFLETNQGSRIKNKRDKLHQKFKNLHTSRKKSIETEDNDAKKDKGEEQEEINSDTSDNEAGSIEKLKQKIKERTLHLKSTIYDPDTSDEESGGNKIKKSQKRPSKKSAESTKLSTKPARMSAKQALENMQKIKSESNRMLREKEVSLPYHRPKALSLKDIMSRRRPAISADGKVLPIKMNEDQLKQYALMLEERQKEMMELCKSDTEEEDIIEDKNDNYNELFSANDKSFDTLTEKPNNVGSRSNIQESMCNENGTNKININEDKMLSYANDKLNNTLIEKPNNKASTSNIQESVFNENERNENNINKDKKDNNNELSSFNDKSYDTVIEKPNNEESRSKIQELVSYKSETNKNNNEENCSISKINKNENANQEQNITIEKSSENTLNEFENEDNHTAIKLYALECLSDEKTETHQQNESLDGNASAEMELVHNDLVEDGDPIAMTSNLMIKNISSEECTENDSQLISLYLDTENSEPVIERNKINSAKNSIPTIFVENEDANMKEIVENNEFPDNDDDINMEEIDFLIENAEIISSQSKEGAVNSPMLVKDFQPLKMKPKLMGAPGMVIDLDGTDACAPKKSGVELLKERFTYFAKLKTPEELEKEKEKRIKPGTQHLKLKYKLEEMIAEQRSLEWAKRLEEERQQKMEIEAVIGDADCEDDIDKIEAKLEETEKVNEEENSSENEEEDLLEDDCEISDKPRNKNPLIDEEAEESEAEDDDCAVNDGSDDEGIKGDDEGEEAENADSEDDTEEESSEEDDDERSNPKKGRILKAFEDSDDDEAANTKEDQERKVTVNVSVKTNSTVCNSELEKESPPSKNTEDDEIQLAQRHKSFSEDLFTSQESVQLHKNIKENVSHEVSIADKSLVSQTFSISKSSNTQWYNTEPTDKQNNEKENLDNLVGMCTSTYSQNLVTSQSETQKENPTEDIGDDILALCTGKFYDNQFVSQLDIGDTQKTEKEGAKTPQNNESPIDRGVQSIAKDKKQDDSSNDKDDCSVKNNTEKIASENGKEQRAEDHKLLNSILDELNDPELETTKPLKYFVGNESQNKENKPAVANSQPKKRFIIDSDDEGNYNDISAGNKKKKLKRKKMQDRALQFSDDEEEIEEYDEDEYESEINDETERIVEYDSEENEVVVQPDNPKKKKKVSEFFEQEAELTSEDEWVGSGDEDEAGLDRMEREAGDDDAFHQGRLRRELEQIHMRDVLDQDKREVRLIQELLLEDGDLGGGHRQRKFRWRDAGGGDEDTTYAELVDTQEEEFESEEQWRKQRHERETFLRQMKQQEEPDEPIDINISRTSLIKANLSSKTANNSILDASDSSIIDKSAAAVSVADKKTEKDIPSPKKPFTLFKQNYHGSLLTRGQGALARLAALALPLAAADDDTHTVRPSHSGRNFVFTALSQEEAPPKVMKRKSDASVETPRLVKKMRTTDKQKSTKNSLLDHLNT